MVRLTIDIPAELDAELRRFCEQQGASREGAAVEMLRRHFAEQKLREPAPPSLGDGGARGEPPR